RPTSYSWFSDSIWSHVPSVEAVHRFRFVTIDVTLDISLIEQVVDADLAERLELEDDLDARQVHPLAPGEEADDTHPPNVRLRVEAEIVPTLRAEEAFLLVDAQRPWMHARQFGGNADEISRPLEVTPKAHVRTALPAGAASAGRRIAIRRPTASRRVPSRLEVTCSPSHCRTSGSPSRAPTHQP